MRTNKGTRRLGFWGEVTLEAVRSACSGNYAFRCHITVTIGSGSNDSGVTRAQSARSGLAFNLTASVNRPICCQFINTALPYLLHLRHQAQCCEPATKDPGNRGALGEERGEENGGRGGNETEREEVTSGSKFYMKPLNTYFPV